jgi:hypothetical protein
MDTRHVNEIIVTSLGLLKVKLNPDPAFHFVYRAACGVIWNDVDHCFEPHEIIKWSTADWYTQIYAAVYSELGCKLVLTQQTIWTNVPTETQAKIRAFDGVMTEKTPKPTRAELTEIKLTDSALLQIKPDPGEDCSWFRHVFWIESNSVWNCTDQCFEPYRPPSGAAWKALKHHPQSQEIISCYKNIVTAIYARLGCTLVLSRRTIWTNVPKEIQVEIQTLDSNHAT